VALSVGLAGACSVYIVVLHVSLYLIFVKIKIIVNVVVRYDQVPLGSLRTKLKRKRSNVLKVARI
jgi:hypothetical protein